MSKKLTKKRKPYIGISLEPQIIHAVEVAALEMGATLGRQVAISEVINRVLAAHLGIALPLDYKLKPPRTNKEQLSPFQRECIELCREFEQSSSAKRKELLQDKQKSVIIRTLFKQITGKDIPNE